MKAVIMAGGEGKRLRPLTCTMPKPMVPLLNKPAIDYCIELLVKHGFDDIYVTLHYLPEILKKHLGDGEKFGASISCFVEDEPLGTAGSVRQAAGDCDEPLLIMSGDAMTDLNLTAAVNAHRRSGALVTMVLKKVRYPTEYGVVITDKDGRVKSFLEKPQPKDVHSDLANTGIYIIEPEALAAIPKDTAYDFSGDLFPKLLESGKLLYSYETDAYWNDIGDIRDYLSTQRDMLDGKCAFNTTAHLRDGVYIEDGAQVNPDAVLLAPCYIGKDAEIAGGSFVGLHSVVCTGAKVGYRASLKRSVLLSAASVRKNAETRGALVCENAHVDTGALLLEGAVLGSGSEAGRGSVIGRDARIWPKKQLEPCVSYNENVVWDDDAGRFRPESYKMGYADLHLTPESAVKTGAAFAALHKLPSQLGVSSDGSLLGTMQKHALISGICARGVDVLDMGSCAYSSFENAIRRFSLNGGAYIMTAVSDARFAELVMCDATGTRILAKDERKLRQTYEAEGRVFPSTSERLGMVEQSHSADKLYEGILSNLLKSDKKQTAEGFALLITGCERTFDVVTRVLLPLGIDTRFTRETSQELLMCAMERVNAPLCFVIDSAQRLKSAIYGDTVLNVMQIIAAIAYSLVSGSECKKLVIPPDMPREYRNFLLQSGADVEYASDGDGMYKREALMRGAYFAPLFETEAMICELVRLEMQGKLMEALLALPAVRASENEVGCSWREVGRVLRSLVEKEREDRVELKNGVTVRDDRGWVSIRPENTLTSFRVVAHSMSEEYADELCDMYSKKVRAILSDGNK